MNLRKWFGIILALGLMVALSPMNALAWRPTPQNHYRGFNHQPRGNAYGWHGQRPPMYQHNRHNFRGHQPNRYGQHHGYLNRNHNPQFGHPGYRGNHQSPYYGTRGNAPNSFVQGSLSYQRAY